MSTGRIRDADLEEVRRRASIVEVASDYMQVKRAGRLFKALCPFHQEKTPSFSIDPAKNLYHCFGCGEGGDVIRLVEKLENLTFVETIERLARRVGVDIRYEQLSAIDRAAQKRRFRLIDAHRAAVEHYHRALLEAPDAADARAYLKGRGFDRVVAEEFQIGFSVPRWEDLSGALRAQGFNEQELVDAGLASRTQEGRIVDRFRGRIMFPIFDITGDPVAFGARRLREDDEGPKYLNSAESPIYSKAKVLYGLHWAKNEIVKGARALLVEGYTDVIALHRAGIKEAVATCGTALGLEHLRTLQRFTQHVVLSLDSDEAGGKAAERTYDQLIGDAQAMGLQVQVVLMTPGDDPADAVARDGAEAFRGLIDGAVPLLEFVLQREAQRYKVGDPEVRARALASGLRILARTESGVVRNEYARRLSDWIRVDPNIIHVELERVLRSGAPPTATSAAVLKRSSAQVRLEREAMKVAIQHPTMVKQLLEDVAPDTFSVPTHRAIWTALTGGADPDALADVLDGEAAAVYRELAVGEIAGEATERLVEDIFRRLKEFVVTRQTEDLKAQLQRLNPTTDPDGYEALFADLIELEKQKRRLSEEGEEA